MLFHATRYLRLASHDMWLWCSPIPVICLISLCLDHEWFALSITWMWCLPITFFQLIHGVVVCLSGWIIIGIVWSLHKMHWCYLPGRCICIYVNIIWLSEPQAGGLWGSRHVGQPWAYDLKGSVPLDSWNHTCVFKNCVIKTHSLSAALRVWTSFVF